MLVIVAVYLVVSIIAVNLSSVARYFGGNYLQMYESRLTTSTTAANDDQFRNVDRP